MINLSDHGMSSFLEMILQNQLNHPLIDEDDVKDMLEELDRISNIRSAGAQLAELARVFELEDLTTAILMQHLLCNTIRLYNMETVMQLDNILANFRPKTVQ
jgi:S-adenosylmethionine:diacylglycerol 3-amino-3-carboxypropyl transferase